MAQSKRARKQERRHPSEHSRNAAQPHHEEHAPEAQASDAHDAVACHLPAVVAGRQENSAEQDSGQSSALTLIARPSATKTAQATKHGLPSAAKAVLISICLTAVVVLSLGALKSNRHAVQVGQAAAAVPLLAAMPESGASSAAVEKNAPPRKTKIAAKHSNHADTTASKPAMDKKLAQVHTRQLMADGAKKKPATTLAKSQKKSLEEQPLLAQNSVALSQSTGAPDRYAQCQEMGNFFRREQCKWQACNGKWGKDGCPSYASDNREFN
ncbi:hypothetical protein [Noviherbaspirillum autotrophicum]|uniref:Uncharacterized protein n=1 Tax=Noviherbaspirillum autotrophicum TaxID=709839 RepID=A0A0C2BGJ9_9BURK|nr:hypothetical protein [Noviherbaspirillum autotrophicum]KIF80370.1 hypothetical protein TSA66_05305 [Noviherbaspirillum autotrophicum]